MRRSSPHYKSALRALKARRKSAKARLDLFDIDVDHDPYAIGLLSHPDEWLFECPTSKTAENVFLYGTNSWGQYLLLSIKWRPLDDFKVNASARLVFKDEEGVTYEMNETQVISVTNGEPIREYHISGLTVQVLAPFRKLRIRVRGYMRRKDTNELVFVRMRLFWIALSNIYDFRNDFNDHFVAKQFSVSPNCEIEFEDRYEQFGQIKGSIQFEVLPPKELYVWGCKAKHYLDAEKSKSKATRIYGFSKNGFAFNSGKACLDLNMSLFYGYTYFGIGAVFPITSTSLSDIDLADINNLVNPLNETVSTIKFTLNVEPEKRSFDITIDKLDLIDNIVVCDMKMNDKEGKAIIIIEDNSQEIINAVTNTGESGDLLTNLVLRIDDRNGKQAIYNGGKGASLSALLELSKQSEANFIVPRGVIVTTNAYQYLLQQYSYINNEINCVEKLAWSKTRIGLKESCEQMVRSFSNYSLPNKIQNEITAQLTSIFGNNFESKAFAVRSSAVCEDTEEMSAAGQMASVLGVKGLSELFESVMKCWASQFAYVAVEYRRGYGQLINSPMAVVIQEMIDCDSAGVMFTCDPLSGDERKLVIAANYGIGESVVSAIAEADTIEINVGIESNSLLTQRKVNGIEKIKIGTKLKRIKLNESEGGIIELKDEESGAQRCCLDDNQIIRLADLGLSVHKFYGNCRDIEWGIKDNQIYCLQSRPIANLDSSFSDWELMHDCDSGQPSESEYYSRANFGEIFPGASSYICLSWLTHTWFASMRGYKTFFNFTKKDFCPFYNFGAGVVNNQLFMSFKNGSPPFSLDPNSMMTKAMQLSVLGHFLDDKELFDDSREKASKRPIRFRNKLNMASTGMAIIFRARKKIKTARNRLNSIDLLKDRTFDSPKQLFEHIVTNSEHMYWALEKQLYGSIYSMIFNMMLMNVLLGNNDKSLSKDFYSDFALLLSSANEVISAEVPNALRDIATAIEEPLSFCSFSDSEALNALQNANTKSSKMFKDFIAKHGHRGYKEFDPLVLQWADNPVLVVKIIKSILADNSRLPKSKDVQSINETVSSMRTQLTASKRFLLKKVILPRCRNGVGMREQAKYIWIWVVNAYRQAFWSLARMLVSEGRIPEPDLLFYLTIDELSRIVTVRDSSLIGRAKRRKRVHSKKDELIFSETIIGPSMRARSENTVFQFDNIDSSLRLYGNTVCGGKVKARVLVALNVEEAANIELGDILVTYSTDIGWSPYFAIISGLITEIGGLMSHGAVIAREYGLPCLIGVEGASQMLKTGDAVILDADVGEIIKV